jgi:trk system potassium uptake protein
MAKQFLVIGAGRFGTSVAKTLYDLGHDVMVVDKNEKLIQEISSEVTDAAVTDASSESSLRALGINNFDAVILAIGYDIQASIMCALLMVEIGAKYTVAKAQTDLHGKVLNKIGINRVIHPERDMGAKLAHSLISPTIIDMIELSDEYSVVEVTAPEDMVGRSLKEIDFRAHYGISIIALRRTNGEQTNIFPVAEDIIKEEDIIVAVGDNKALKKLEWI